MRFRLLCCLAKAIAKYGVKFLCGLVPGGDVLFDIASETWEDYREGRPDDGLRAELGALAQAPADEVRQEADLAAQAAAAHLPADERQKLATYLGQVPGMIRRSLRRPADPTGTTVPADLRLQSPEDLLPFLPPSPPRFQPGMRPLPGVPWVLEEPLGVGGFGEVWKARHAHLKSKPPVALKFCLDPSAARALRNEAGVLDRLMQHGRLQGIVPLQQAYLDADPPCLEYEYVEGGDLTGAIRELHARGRPSPETASRLLLRLADIVAAAHRADPPIVHDDLKPSNVLVRRVAKGLELHVTDYGIGGVAVARAVKQTRQPTNSREQLMTEAVRGAYTPLYASLEQMTRKREEPPDPRDDVHALGMIWYQLVTGELTMLRLPADWTDELRGRGLSERMIRLLGTCLAKAEKRPASAGVLAEELRALTKPMAKEAPAQPPEPTAHSAPYPMAIPLPDVLPTQAPPPPPPAKPPKPKRRGLWRRPVLWVVLSVLLLGPVVAYFVWAMNQHPAGPSPLDCTRDKGVSAPDVRKAQEAWASYLGRQVEEEDEIAPGVKMKFVLVPPGKFNMGSPTGEKERSGDEVQHEVEITKPFYLGVYDVTQVQYEALLGKDKNQSNFKGADLPVETVSWEEADDFAKKLTQKAKGGLLYRLPTEAEWEYSCRGGRPSSQPFGIGDGTSLSSHDANFNGNYPYGGAVVGPYLQKTTPVGTYKANALGLYDMQGNVWQWCSDWYGDYPPGRAVDPQGPGTGSSRVNRGGGWSYDAMNCRAAYRNRITPGYRNINLGFRLARVPPSGHGK